MLLVHRGLSRRPSSSESGRGGGGIVEQLKYRNSEEQICDIYLRPCLLRPHARDQWGPLKHLSATFANTIYKTKTK